MDHLVPSFRRRAAAGVIDLAICGALTMAFTIAWIVTHAEPCACETTASLERYLTNAAFAAEPAPDGLYLMPTLLYVLWSWSPIAGGRSVGKHLMRIRAIVADR